MCAGEILLMIPIPNEIKLTGKAVLKMDKYTVRPLRNDNSFTITVPGSKSITNRALLLAALSFVNAVTLFDEDTPYNLIKTVMPDVLVKGGDYKIEDIVGHDIVEANGGKVTTIPLTEGYSTTKTIEKLGVG